MLFFELKGKPLLFFPLIDTLIITFHIKITIKNSINFLSMSKL